MVGSAVVMINASTDEAMAMMNKPRYEAQKAVPLAALGDLISAWTGSTVVTTVTTSCSTDFFKSDEELA